QVAVQLRPEDNVAVAARPIPPGTELEYRGQRFNSTGRVGLGHKIALRDVKKGEPGYKHGQGIGFPSEDVPAGGDGHAHHLARADVTTPAADNCERDYAFCRDCPPPPPRPEPRTWMGYDRGGGRYGTRNYVAIISTVNCSASTSKYVSEKFRSTDLLARYPNV